jgi:Flp pilus assembly protein TadB
MTPSLPSLLFAAIAFVIAFGIAKWIANRKRRGDGEKSAVAQRSTQSRQVRRARDRRNKR